MEINKIVLNGVEYEIVDKATREAIARIDERYISDVTRADINAQNISDVVTNGFNILDYKYFYFCSTSEDRKLYTKLGNTIHQNSVCSTEHLSNVIDNQSSDEVITIYYGN